MKGQVIGSICWKWDEGGRRAGAVTLIILGISMATYLIGLEAHLQLTACSELEWPAKLVPSELLKIEKSIKIKTFTKRVKFEDILKNMAGNLKW